MKTISAAIQTIATHKADIASAASVFYLSCHRIYTYVCDKGGLRSMYSRFMGPKQFPAVVQAANPTPAIAERPAGDSGESKP